LHYNVDAVNIEEVVCGVNDKTSFISLSPNRMEAHCITKTEENLKQLIWTSRHAEQALLGASVRIIEIIAVVGVTKCQAGRKLLSIDHTKDRSVMAFLQEKLKAFYLCQYMLHLS
jgi:hypothetical protein